MKQEPPSCPSSPPIRGAVAAGLVLLLVFLGGMSAWGNMAPLASAAIAQGTVNLDTYRKTVQHLEGGIISRILVREGQDVNQGDVLIELDETQALSRIELLKAQIAAEESQLSFLGEEIAGIEELLRRGLARKNRLLGLYRRRAELDGNRTEHQAQLRAAMDVAARAKIRAPITGTVVGLKVHTPGGVIKPGDPLLSIVPKDEPLVIEARIDPNDIDIVHKGLAAQVRLTPLNARIIPPLPGRIVWISADRLNDATAGTSHYLARVKLTALPSDLPNDVSLYPGMPAKVIILAGERTFMSYLFAPLTRSLRRAFREK